MTALELMASLKGLSIQELDGIIAAAERERQAKRDAARKTLLEEMRTKAEALGLSLNALLESAELDGTSRSSRAPVRPKYRDPETGETWSGRGSAPAWLKRLEGDRRSREEFAIRDSA